MTDAVEQIQGLADELAGVGYISSEDVATVVYLGDALGKPVLVEGPPGVGKTELARALADVVDRELIRLQCYEGLDEGRALYEWKYGKQLLYTQLLRDRLGSLLADSDSLDDAVRRLDTLGGGFFSEPFLEARPLLQALRSERGAVLLIDEVDKSDPEFEAFLLEFLADYQVTIPELGTIGAVHAPMVFLTSNGSRELSEALKRRCLHLHIPYPDRALEERILAQRVPGMGETLRAEVVAFVHGLRVLDLRKRPAISETLDWARTLLLLQADRLDTDLVQRTLNVLLKFQDDVETATPRLRELQAGARS